MEGSPEKPDFSTDDEQPSSLLSGSSPASTSYEHPSLQNHDQSHDQFSAFMNEFGPGQIKSRGRKIGDGAGLKRKAEDNLSDNPHTKKARARKEQMSEIEQIIERAKNADRQAKTRVRKKVMEGADYLSADEIARQELVNAAEAREMSKRHALGRSGTAVAAKLGYGEEGGLYASWDDGNDAWEDVEEAINNPFYEKRVQENDIENRERLPTDKDILEATDRATIQQKRAVTMAQIQFKHWARFWLYKLRKYNVQLKELSRRGEIGSWEKWHYDLTTNKIYEIEPPHMFFADPSVRAIYRNMSSWLDESDCDKDSDAQAGWYTLPGPADWWCDHYDYKTFGFDIEAGSSDKYERAFEMIFELTQPEAFKWVLPGIDELMVLSHTRETEVLLQFFG